MEAISRGKISREVHGEIVKASINQLMTWQDYFMSWDGIFIALNITSDITLKDFLLTKKKNVIKRVFIHQNKFFIINGIYRICHKRVVNSWIYQTLLSFFLIRHWSPYIHYSYIYHYTYAPKNQWSSMCNIHYWNKKQWHILINSFKILL